MLRAVAGGSGSGGDVVGPASSTLNATARFADTTGNLLKDSSFWVTTDNGASLILGPTTTSPGFFAGLSGDTVARVAIYLSPTTDAGRLGFGAGGASAQDVFITRDAANISAQRNGTTAQTFRVYNTYTDASNYERGVMDWTTTANTLTIGAQAAGSGTLRAVAFVGGSTFTFNQPISVVGAILGSSDVRAGSSGSVYFNARSKISSSADGLLRMVNIAGSGFTALLLGPSGTDYPRLAPSGTAGLLQVKLADDSAFSSIQALAFITAPVAVSALGSASPAGQKKFVNDALAPAFGATVAGGGAVTVPVYSDGSNWVVG